MNKIRYFVQLALHKQARPLRSHRTRVPACGNKIRILSRCAAARVPPLCNRAAYATLAACYNSAPLRGSRSNERSKGRKAPIIKHIPRFQLLSKKFLDRRGNVCYHRHCTRGSFFAVSTMRLTPTLRRFAPVRSPHCSRLTRQRQQPGRAFSFFGKFHKNRLSNSCSLPMNSPRFF